ncbi:MAG: PadR family transcriptional regulator, partial [Candidatus Izemoplasma sp.]
NMIISESTIYPILRKMVKEDFCSTYLRESNEGPPRKYFKITKIGRIKLEELLSDWEKFEKVVNRMTRGDVYE